MRPAFFAALALVAVSAAPPPHIYVKHLSVLRPDGKAVRVSDLAGRRGLVVVFASLYCPLSISYHAELARLAKEYGPRGIAVVAVLPADSVPAGVEKEARDAGLTVPVLIDRGMKLAAATGATITPEAAVFDDKLHLMYRGRIDDAYTERLKRNAVVTRRDLRDAIEKVLDIKPIAEPRTRAVGCRIVFSRPEIKAGARYIYHRDVAPILRKSCQACHRPGGAGPFALTTYTQARHWAEDIAAFTRSRQMPPWPPAGGVPFQNDRRLSAAEIAILNEWAESGAPEGEPKDAPPDGADPGEWALGKPDLILEAEADFKLGGEGSDLFRVFTLPMGLKEDRWVVAYDVKPGTPRVVHHTLHFFDTTGAARKMEAAQAKRDAGKKPRDSGPGYTVSMGVGFVPPRPKVNELPAFGGLGGWAPGQSAQKLPAGAGLFLPAGSDFLLQVHYHRDGKPAADRTRVGLYFARGRIEQPWQVLTVRGMKDGAVIPAGKAEHRMRRAMYLHTDAQLHNVMAHMHLLGKSVKVTLTPPGGKPVVLLDIPAWDYRWQETYWFREPLRVKAGTRVEVEGVFDNSAANPLNPSRPPRDVREGDQTTDEMLYAFLGATSAASPWQFVTWGDTPAPKSAAEAMKVLARRVGSWETETEIAGVKVKGTEVTAWALGGKFIESKGKTAAGETRMLVTYDETRKAYRYWYFDSEGLTTDGTGRYDPETKSIRWDAGGSEAVWRFTDADRLDWTFTTRDAKGKAAFEMRGWLRRKK